MKLFEKYITEDFKHVVYKIFGIKINIKNFHAKLYRSVAGMNRMLNYISDIENLPKAKGEIRDAQIKTIEILKIFGEICQSYQINYWLDFGTLLGAARHKGYIPWDEDVDVCMVRDDYEKILPILKKELKESNYYICEHGVGTSSFNIKVVLKNSGLHLDIFPVDKYPAEKRTETLNALIYEKYNKARKNFDKKHLHIKHQYSEEEFKTAQNDIKYFEEREGLISKNNTIEKPVLFFAIDYPHLHKYKCFDYDTIFPLKTLEFEGLTFNVPNKYEKHLSGIYGDWKCFPNHFENLGDFFWNNKS